MPVLQDEYRHSENDPNLRKDGVSDANLRIKAEESKSLALPLKG